MNDPITKADKAFHHHIRCNPYTESKVREIREETGMTLQTLFALAVDRMWEHIFIDREGLMD